MNKVRTIIIDGIEIETGLSAIEIANLPKISVELMRENEKLKEKNTIYKSTIKGQYNKIKELQNSKRISKEVHKKRNMKLKEENEKLNHYKLLYQKVKERNDKAIEVIDTQMKLAEDGVKENLRIIKFYLIKGECSIYDLTTEEDYKYKRNNDQRI